MDYSSIRNSAGVGSEFEETDRFCQVVSILSDFLVEGEEEFLLSLQNDQEFVQFTLYNTTITIEDSDGQINISIEF